LLQILAKSLSNKIHVVNDPKCACGSPIEDAIHYLLKCQLYYNQRISLFNDLIIMHIRINIETLLEMIHI
jgi:hypothetical protein